jgi:hypothetical protein
MGSDNEVFENVIQLTSAASLITPERGRGTIVRLSLLDLVDFSPAASRLNWDVLLTAHCGIGERWACPGLCALVHGSGRVGGA